jgi:hypothetical protein
MNEELESSERQHRGHTVVQMATARYDILLSMDRAREWDAPKLVEALEAALVAINARIIKELAP